MPGVRAQLNQSQGETHMSPLLDHVVSSVALVEYGATLKLTGASATDVSSRARHPVCHPERSTQSVIPSGARDLMLTGA